MIVGRGLCCFRVVAKSLSRCINCGLVIPVECTKENPCYSRCKAKQQKEIIDPFDCTHNLGPYDDYEAHAVCGCPSSKKQGMTTLVCECEIHGDVTPLAKKTVEELKSCIGCQDYHTKGSG